MVCSIKYRPLTLTKICHQNNRDNKRQRRRKEMKEACSASLDWKLDEASVCTMDIGSYPRPGRAMRSLAWTHNTKGFIPLDHK